MGFISAIGKIIKTVATAIKDYAKISRATKRAKNARNVLIKKKAIKDAGKILTHSEYNTVRRMKYTAEKVLGEQGAKKVIEMTEKGFVGEALKQARKEILRREAGKLKTAVKNYALEKTGADKFVRLGRAVRDGSAKELVKEYIRDFAPAKFKRAIQEIMGFRDTMSSLSIKADSDIVIQKAIEYLKKSGHSDPDEDTIAEVADEMAKEIRKKTAEEVAVRVAKMPLDDDTRTVLYNLKTAMTTGKVTAKMIERIKHLFNYQYQDIEGVESERTKKQRLEEEAERDAVEEKARTTGKQRVVPDKKDGTVRDAPNITAHRKNAISWEAETGHKGRERSFAIDNYRFVKNSSGGWDVYYHYRKKHRDKKTKQVSFSMHPKEYSVRGLDVNLVKWLESSSSKGRAFRALTKGLVPQGSGRTLPTTAEISAFLKTHPETMSEIQKRKENAVEMMKREKQTMLDLSADKDNMMSSQVKSELKARRKNIKFYKDIISTANSIADAYRKENGLE